MLEFLPVCEAENDVTSGRAITNAIALEILSDTPFGTDAAAWRRSRQTVSIGKYGVRTVKIDDGLPSARLHCEDGPALTHTNGTKEYYFEGFLHRDDDEPAFDSPTGPWMYFRHGKFHRDGCRPALVLPDGTQFYYREGELTVGGVARRVMMNRRHALNGYGDVI